MRRRQPAPGPLPGQLWRGWAIAGLLLVLALTLLSIIELKHSPIMASVQRATARKSNLQTWPSASLVVCVRALRLVAVVRRDVITSTSRPYRSAGSGAGAGDIRLGRRRD